MTGRSASGALREEVEKGSIPGTRKRSERVTGIEPALAAWEAAVMPFHYTREPAEPVGQA